MQGEIQNLLLPDLIQWLAHTRRTGKLIVTESVPGETRQLTAAKPSVEFYFANGELAMAAQGGDSLSLSVENARAMLGSALAWRSGRFVFDATPLLPLWVASANLHLSPQTLLQDVAGELSPSPKPTTGELLLDKAIRARKRPHGFKPAESLRLQVVDRVLRENFTIPAMPELAARVLELMLDDNFSLRELGNLVLTDQAVSALILRYANSALNGAGRRVDSLTVAVQRLGAQEVVNIVLATALMSCRLRTDLFADNKRRLWCRASASAFISRALAARVGLDGSLGFLCGLLMDFGTNVLYSVIQDTLVRNAKSTQIPTQLVEEIVEDYHAHVGCMVGESWRLPQTVIEVMAYHHRAEEGVSTDPYVAVAALADYLAGVALSVPRAGLEDLLSRMTAGHLAAHPAARLLKLDERRAAAMLADLPRCIEIAAEFVLD